MSAECNTCGFDIVYPEGTWPVGVCLNCKQGDEIEALRERVRRLEAVTVAARELQRVQTAETSTNVEWANARQRLSASRLLWWTRPNPKETRREREGA